MEETRNASSLDEEDSISKLPDSIIHHIMSFMDTKYAVQTCVLSKRWINIWKSLAWLNFCRDSFSLDKTDKFLMFVDMVFIFRRQDIDILKLNVTLRNAEFEVSINMNVSRWCLNAVMHNVQEICLLVYEMYPAYEIPHHILNCKSLRKLEMRMRGDSEYVDIILPRWMNLPQLRVLSLVGISISDVESSKRLFSRCPVLETLELVDSNIPTNSQRNLIVDSVSLKKFSYTFLYPLNPHPNIIKLCAPCLEEFSCRAFLSQDFSVENSSPLSSVSLLMTLEEFHYDECAETYSDLSLQEKQVYAKRMVQFLGAVDMVKTLTLSPGFLEVFSQALDLLDCQLPRLHNLKYLTLQMWSTRGCMRGTACVLSVSPNIEELYLEYKEPSSVNVGDDWEAGLSLPGMLSHLKTVQIEELEGSESEHKILSFLLKNANVLERVALYFRQVERFKKKLLAVQTASSSVKLEFN